MGCNSIGSSLAGRRAARVMRDFYQPCLISFRYPTKLFVRSPLNWIMKMNPTGPDAAGDLDRDSKPTLDSGKVFLDQRCHCHPLSAAILGYIQRSVTRRIEGAL